MANERIPPGHMLVRLAEPSQPPVFAVVNLATGEMTWGAVAWLPLTMAHYALARAMASWTSRDRPKRQRGDNLEADLVEAAELYGELAAEYRALTEALWPDRDEQDGIRAEVGGIYAAGVSAQYEPENRVQLDALYNRLSALNRRYGPTRTERERVRRHMKAVENEMAQIGRALEKQRARERKTKRRTA